MSHYDNRTVPDGWYDRLIARFYDPFTNYFERGFMGRRRRELLAGLQGSILEVGAGTGANFDHYPPGASVLAIEPSAAMLQRAAEKRAALTAKHADIRLLHAGIGDPEVSRYVPESGFDAIVLTLVLCTIPDPRAAITTLHEWLRPGGRLYVLEHIINASQPGRTLQQCADPVWTQIAAGCHLTRPTDELLKQGGFRPEWETYYQRGLRFYQAVMKPDGRRQT